MTEWNLDYRYNAPRYPWLHIVQEEWLWIDFVHLSKLYVNYMDNDENMR